MPKKPKILLVEDNRDDEDLALLAIEISGVPCEVQVARDGAEALKILMGEDGGRANDLTAPPRLVILDLKMPKVSGLEVLEAMRKDPRNKHVPVVVLTSSAEERDLADAYAFGATSYIRKPIDLEDFNVIMAGICSYWLLWNENPPSVNSDRAVDDTPA